jgi:hypothetical protein
MKSQVWACLSFWYPTDARKRPAFSPRPPGSAVVCMKASSTEAELSAARATLIEP